ncbi:hypothetical protein CCR91_21230 [Thiorhodovibrio winogradskyi]|nr:hypothetical protein [Thiorhodovibrio winogradskyi]
MRFKQLSFGQLSAPTVQLPYQKASTKRARRHHKVQISLKQAMPQRDNLRNAGENILEYRALILYHKKNRL